jgi:hypothetical protein
LPHFEINTPPERERPPVEVFDFSALNAGDDAFQIDTGVTSGADSSSWDEISIDEGRVDTCADSAKGQAADKSTPAVCKSSTKP